VGAYNTATHEICRYSACGPTRSIGGNPATSRKKPEVCAPAEEEPAGRGVLSASSLRSQPTRMSGTSASAPHVAGLVALMYQYIRDAGRNKHSADEMRDLIMQGAQTSPPLKQKDVAFGDLTGAGKVNVTATLDLL
jgi:subtilisin family serine protease